MFKRVLFILLYILNVHNYVANIHTYDNRGKNYFIFRNITQNTLFHKGIFEYNKLSYELEHSMNIQI